MEKTNQELEVDRLLNDLQKERRVGSYSNWPLCKVPFEIIWNEFSRSNWRLVVEI